MKKPVGRLLYPNTGWYFAAMLLFTAAAAAVGQYILAGGALFVTLIMFIISRARLSRRKRQLMSYVQTATDSVGISVHAGSAFPMAVIRLPENEIIWGNPSFFTSPAFPILRAIRRLTQSSPASPPAGCARAAPSCRATRSSAAM